MLLEMTEIKTSLTHSDMIELVFDQSHNTPSQTTSQTILTMMITNMLKLSAPKSTQPSLPGR